MRTKIKTIHEEEYSDNSKTLGVLLNHCIDTDWKESFIYIYRNENYIIFNTIIDMLEYLLYANKSMKRAYITEKDFDELYDSEYIDGKLIGKLKWVFD